MHANLKLLNFKDLMLKILVCLMIRLWICPVLLHSEICPNQWELKLRREKRSSFRDSLKWKIMMVKDIFLYAPVLYATIL